MARRYDRSQEEKETISLFLVNFGRVYEGRIDLGGIRGESKHPVQVKAVRKLFLAPIRGIPRNRKTSPPS